jgi:hypothetical protein
MAKNKSRLPFDKNGGTLVTQRRLYSSSSWLQLSPQAKVLMILMQRYWTPMGPVGFGVRQAEEEIPCSRTLALRVFRELIDGGFIVMVDESLFCSRAQSKTRTWRLTWMPCWNNRASTNDWERQRVSISTGP